MGPADLSHQGNQKPIPMVTFTQLRWPLCPRQPRLQWDYAGVVGGGVYQDSALLSQTLTSLSVVGGVKGGHFPRPDRKPAQHRRRFPLSPWYWGPLLPCWSSQVSLDLLSVPHNPAPFLQGQSLSDKYLTCLLCFPNLPESHSEGRLDRSQRISSQVALYLDAC